MNLYATFVHRRILRGPSGGEQSGATAVECGGDGGSALASRLSENEHIGMRNYKIQNYDAFERVGSTHVERFCGCGCGRATPGPYSARDGAFGWASGVARPRVARAI